MNTSTVKELTKILDKYGKKERRCLKFTGYIYLPNEQETYNDLRYYAARTPGRLIIFDEFGNRPQSKAIGFDNLGEMLAKIERVRQKRIYSRVKRK
jgi:hypothetical protein